MASKVFNTKEWGIGEWAAALGIAWIVYQAIKDNERTARMERRAELGAEGPDLLLLPDGRMVPIEKVV